VLLNWFRFLDFFDNLVSKGTQKKLNGNEKKLKNKQTNAKLNKGITSIEFFVFWGIN